MKKKLILMDLGFNNAYIRKILTVMRITFLLCVLGVMQVAAANSYSQEARISLDVREKAVSDVLREIEEKSEFFFLYNNKLIDVDRVVDVDVKNKSITKVLDLLFADNVQRDISDRQIVLSPAVQQDESLRKGTVLSADDGLGLPGVSVVIKGTTVGTSTDIDGAFTIKAEKGDILIFSFMGMVSQEFTVVDTKPIEISLRSDALQMEEVVVTALGISRDKKSLGYAVTKVDGDEITKTKAVNLTSSLNGRVAGVNISSSAGFGGSSNIVIRGGSSISGNNQALFVIDGVAISNTSITGKNTLRGGYEGGYDYGNFASDINPEDVESVSVLKGASATALYGARGANGVVIITTKKGKSRKGMGVSVSSSVNFETINKKTLPNYQNDYGAGYWDNFDTHTTPEGVDQKVVMMYDDASWGPKFDPNLMVRHWDSWDPSDPENYGKTRAWVAPDNMDEFFETGVLWVNSVALDGGSEKGNYRLSYTNTDQKGTMPNQSLKKNNLNFNGNFNLTEKLSIQVNSQYNRTESKGRPGLGYSSTNSLSFMGSMMWHQRNLDFKRLKNYQTASGEQKTWNRASASDPTPVYWDNPYWTRAKNYQNDLRNRIVGSVALNYKISSWLSASMKATTDHFDFLNEERIAKGGKGISDYTKQIRTETEDNFQVNLNIDKRFDEDFHLTGLVGIAQRNNEYIGSTISTVGGLVVDNVYSIANSKSKEIAHEGWKQEQRVNSVFGSFSLGYKNFLYLDLTGRNDWSSTLPSGNNSFFYPSVSTSFVFSELTDLSFLNYGKLRLNWAQVGNDTGISRLRNVYYANGSFGNATKYEASNTINNPELKPELTTSYEIGLDLSLFQNRVGLDFSYYNKKSKDQIIGASIPSATGYNYKYLNSGEIENKGVEIGLKLVPIKTKDFTWNMNLNWSKNVSEVLSLAPGVDDYVLNSNGAKVIARVGEEFGIITGTDYVRDENGNKLIADGRYVKSSPGEIIGKATPDWIGGISNSFTYKGFTLSSLISVHWGGDIYSYTEKYGRMSGVLAETAGLNELGNEKRDAIADGGGVLLQGMNAMWSDSDQAYVSDGTANTTRTTAEKFHSWSNPDAEFMVDGTYVKLRELSLSYRFPKTFFGNLPVQDVSVSLIGRNLATLYKKSDHFDPEVVNGVGVGGLEGGSLPSKRTIGCSLKFNF